ncbi:efflux RND transporter periplasmic adaptor subunit [Neobacillus sp. MM2021_6]|uniref:efflux RND transporter periplasmic adaptor subunit n=1 Tax=Bacillaceae TaxID=186817 RepID=UPI001407C1AA|nr:MULTISPECIES: efflux RND transporter periplasmic adaptor subunit [Bacillaceae]MBO0961146.1 efflux RND transporter periplasmic adaptor subunit [Neobacillus sp. MM2021_6]NHC19343.1 efflux RND transporter periplasmic adaptor subunit [Bacillus sp. MM2020_4]
MKKWILIGVGVLVVGFVGYQWYSSKTNAQTTTSQGRTAVVQKGKLEVNISGSGTVQPVISADIKSISNNEEIDEVLVATGEEVKEGDELITFTDGSDPITAPATGRITTISVAAGERVTSGQVVAHVTNYQDLQTLVQIDELDISKIKEGQVVNVKVNASPDHTYTGKVSAVADEGISTNGVSTFDVTIHIDNAESLKVGMSVEASILTASKEDALYVPLDAIHTANGEKYVLAVSSGSDNQTIGSEQKVVKTGLANEDYVEITEGISAGDTIQLPQLASGNSTNNSRRMMQGGFGGGMGGMGNMGGMNRNGGGPGQVSGRSGN